MIWCFVSIPSVDVFDFPGEADLGPIAKLTIDVEFDSYTSEPPVEFYITTVSSIPYMTLYISKSKYHCVGFFPKSIHIGISIISGDS